MKAKSKKCLTAEQRAWIGLKVLDPQKLKKVERFCRKTGLGPQRVIREAFEGTVGDHIHGNDGLNNPDFIKNAMIDAGKL